MCPRKKDNENEAGARGQDGDDKECAVTSDIDSATAVASAE